MNANMENSTDIIDFLMASLRINFIPTKIKMKLSWQLPTVIQGRIFSTFAAVGGGGKNTRIFMDLGQNIRKFTYFFCFLIDFN